MRKLTAEEFSDLPMGWHGKASPFFRAIIGLKKGEGCFIGKEEWNMYKTPSRICRYLEKKFPVKYLCVEKKDKSGWEIRRVE